MKKRKALLKTILVVVSIIVYWVVAGQFMVYLEPDKPYLLNTIVGL